MDWVLKHLQLVIALAGAVAWWLNQRRLATKDNPEPHAEATFDDAELAERTRRIREEIQRKIEQRARAYAEPQPQVTRPAPVAPPPIMREAVVRPSGPPPLTKAAAARQETQRHAEILEEQAALTERLRQADEMKAAMTRRTQFESHVSSGREAAAAARSALTDDLGNPQTLRRAFILREILGPPVALRG